MQVAQVLLILVVGALGDDSQANPLSKVFQLIGDLRAKVVADGEAEQKAFEEYTRWCHLTSKTVENEIETSTAQENKLTAKTDELISEIEVADSKVSELAASISKAEAELKSATAIRKKEAEEFAAGEKELMGTIDTLERAVSVLERELSTGGSFAQIDTSSLENLMQSLSAVTDAAGLTGNSKQQLLAMVQAHEVAKEDEDELGAPAGAKYSSHSGGIMDVLEDMKEKAESQLADIRKTETSAKNSYNLLRESLQDDIAATTKELNDEKAGKEEDKEEKASAEGNLETTSKELKGSKKKDESLKSDCQTAATDHEANLNARKNELKTIDEAKKILEETTGGAESQSYSFLQVVSASRLSLRLKARESASRAVVAAVQQLAKDHHSAALAQLSSRMSAELKYKRLDSANPFEKVTKLIKQMIAQLEKEASNEATEKAYCDEQMAKTKTKKGELEDVVAKLTGKIDKSASASAALKSEVKELMLELSKLAKEQVEMDKIRREEHSAFVTSKKDLELGLEGVRRALSVLREFYMSKGSDAALLQTDDDSQSMSSLMQQAERQPAPPEKAEKSTGAGSGIISLLEVVESDFAKNLASEDAAEGDAQSSYDKQTQANKITKAEKEQDVKGKTQDFKYLDKQISELEGDKATEDQELAAVNEYYAKIKERCIAKPSTYEERKKRRDEEIAGLKDALANLDSQSSFVQLANRPGRRSNLRGDALQTE